MSNARATCSTRWRPPSATSAGTKRSRARLVPTPLWNFCWRVSSSAVTATLGTAATRPRPERSNTAAVSSTNCFAANHGRKESRLRSPAGSSTVDASTKARSINHRLGAGTGMAMVRVLPRRSTRASSPVNSVASVTMAEKNRSMTSGRRRSSTGVKLLRRPEVMERFFSAIVTEATEFTGDEARVDLRGRTLTIAMPVPAPKRWLIERAFVDASTVELPAGDLNLDSLRPWFAAKQFVELTAAVLDRSGRGLVAAVPSVAVTADELTLQQKFQSGVGTNLALDLFVPADVAEGVRQRVEQVARAFDLEGYARLDLFWDQEADVVHLLEINSLCGCLLYTSPSPRDRQKSRMPSSA